MGHTKSEFHAVDALQQALQVLPAIRSEGPGWKDRLQSRDRVVATIPAVTRRLIIPPAFSRNTLVEFYGDAY